MNAAHRISIAKARAALIALAALSGCLLTAACGAPGVATPQPSPTVQGNGVTPILATTVLRTGTQRVAFLLAGQQDIVRAPTATVRTAFLEAGGGASSQTATATFHLWPYGARGSYATYLTFERAGRWRLDIGTEGEATTHTATLDVNVTEHSPVVDVGELPPLLANKTLRDVQSLAELTSDPTPDAALYETTIPDAVISGKPTVIVFATPAFCTSPTCGPQVDTVSELRAAYQDRANFIHVEIYDNPEEVQGDLAKARYAPTVEAWGLTKVPGWNNESWVFILGRKGRVADRFQGYATLEELETALAKVL